MHYRGIPIQITTNPDESAQHFSADFAALIQGGIENLIKNDFIPWLLGDDFADRDIDKVYDGLKPYEVTYHYGKIVAQYSPTGADGYFGQFEFCFESGDDYTRDILQAVAMRIYVHKGQVVKISGYDI